MGTETRLTKCSILFNKLVKLNNPLMGTETPFKTKTHCTDEIRNVKLNNPLMGTETIIFLDKVIISCPPFVKLNNPLMGTETSPVRRS